MKTMKCSGALMCLFLLLTPFVNAQQLKLGTAPNVIEKSALLDLNSDKQGLLLPRVSDYTVAPLSTAPDGMLIYSVTDKLLYIRKNGIWRKLIDETNGITSVNGQTGPVVNLTTNNISESVNLYYTDTRARAAFSAGTGINLSGAGVISALNTSALWNASQLQGRNISTNAPANNDVLSWDNATSTWLPKAVASGSGSVTSVGLALPSIFTVSGSPVTSTGTLTGALASQTLRTVFAAPVAANGVPSFRALDPLDIPSGSTNYIQNISSGTQTASFAVSGNGNVGGTFSLPSLTTGSVLFTGASGLVSQNNTNFFWDNTNNRLGLGTNSPNNTLEVGGTVAASGLSGLRLTGMGAATLQSPLPNVLAVNATGDVIVTSNPAANNWLLTGNTGNASTAFLGNTDDKAMVIKSNNLSYLEFARRQTLGLVQSYTDYTDPDEKVTYVRSALQFEVPATVSFYKPKMWTTSDGNFRMKGPSAGTDYFEFGATGTSNNGGFEFIIGDDGDEPIVFKSYNYTGPTFTEIMRLQNNNVGIGLAGATPVKRLHIDANSDAIRIVNLASSGTGNPLVINSSGDIKQTTALDGVTVGATTRASGAFTTLAGASTSIGISSTTVNDLAIGNYSFIRLTSSVGNYTITGIAAGVDGQVITIYNTVSNMTIVNQNASSTAANRIIVTTGASIATTGIGTVTMIYSAADARWIITSTTL